MNNILIIGCGHMGTALLNTWLNKTKNSFTIVDPIRYKILNRKYKKKINCFNNISQINYFIKFDIVILAVKPQATDSALKTLKKLKYKKNVLFMTIIAGKKLLFYKRYLPLNSQIIRVMPNLPASIEKGMSCIYPNKLTTKKNINKAIFLFRKVGKVLILNSEKDIDKVTAVSGSGPGYFFLFIHYDNIDIFMVKNHNISIECSTSLNTKAYFLHVGIDNFNPNHVWVFRRVDV